jgi:hypothetical protein
MMIYTSDICALLIGRLKFFVLRLAVDHGEQSQQKFCWLIGRPGVASRRRYCGPFWCERWPVLQSCEFVFSVLQCWHRSCDHLTLKPSKTPCLSSELNDFLNSSSDGLFFFGVSKVLDRNDNLVHYGPSCGIDTLLSAAASECGKKGLLAPDGFLAGALVADMAAH